MSARGHVLSMALAALLVSAGGSVQAASFSEVAWDAKGRFEQRRRVPAGERYELCAKLSRGTEVKSEFRAGAALDFNVHHHVGSDVIYAVEKSQVDDGHHNLRAGLDQTYCWMWTNRSTDAIEVKIKLSRKQP